MSEDFQTFLEVMRKLSGIASGIEPKRQEILQDLARAKGKQFPSRLFHYTSLRAVSGILHSNNLWATDFRFLNDASELVYGATILVEELRKFGDRSGGDILRLLERVANFYQEHGDKYRQFFETYVISLSEEPDILSQWLAYGDGARGHCIEFDFSDSKLFTVIGSNTTWALEMSPVIYDENTQKQLAQRGIDKLLNYLSSTEWTIVKVVAASEAEQGVILGLLLHAFEPFLTSFKHPRFSAEREWRVVASCVSDLTVGHKKQTTQDSNARSYLECIFVQGDEIKLWQRRYLPITSIVHGPLAELGAITALEKTIEAEGYKDLISAKKSAITPK